MRYEREALFIALRLKFDDQTDHVMTKPYSRRAAREKGATIHNHAWERDEEHSCSKL